MKRQKIKIQKKNSKGSRETFWIVVAMISTTVYILWRLIFTIPQPGIYGWLATICGICLALSEAISMLEGSEHFLRLRKKTVPDMPIVPPERFPDVDVLIPTHNEEPELLYKTVNGCKYMDYPDKSKVHIYLCDDGNRPEVAALAKEMGVGYFGLSGNKLAKAGNMNNALAKTSSPWVVCFDADMIPTHDFLMQTVPYTFLPTMKKMDNGTWVDREENEIDENYKIGFIQTPQSFYNPDLFQYNFYSEERVPNEQDYFFREINVGRNSANACIFAGSNTLISRKALDEIGGITVGTITEDFETGLNIQSRGYTCYAVDKALAHGLAPTDVDSLIKQRVRWGRGCVSSLRRVHLFFNPHLTFNAKISYLTCLVYWWTFFRRFVFILSPILFVLFNIPVVICSLPELLLIWLPSFLLYNHALTVTSGRIRNKRWSNTIDTVIFPYMIIPIFLETLFIKEKKFNVTQKTRSVSDSNNVQLAIPQILLLGFDALALFISAVAAFETGNFGGIVVIYWLGVNALHLIMAIFFMVGRPNLRTDDRFEIHIPVEVKYMDHQYTGVTHDLSETGMSILMEKPLYMAHGSDDMKVSLRTDRYSAELQAKCVHVTQKDQYWKYGMQITSLEGKDKDQYFQILYDRDHSLAKVTKAATGIFDDIFVNVQHRSALTVQSQRELPRISLNVKLRSVDGRLFRIKDTNYEYIVVESSTGLPEQIMLQIPESGQIMVCKKSELRPGLYRVDNWRQLLQANAYDSLLELTEKEEDASPKTASVQV